MAVLAGAPSPARGQGWYLGSELGAHAVQALGTEGLSNDRASVCDEFINPQYATVTRTAGYEDYNCTGQGRSDNWVNQFGGAAGLHTSWVLGYRFGADASGRRWSHLRAEAEYFYRTTSYDQTVDVPGVGAGSGGVTADKLDQELRTATDYIGRVTSHTAFANLYWDIRTGGRLTPYVGAGVGIGSTAVGYGSLWSRNPDPAAIATGDGLPNADEIRRNLAATTSSFRGVAPWMATPHGDDRPVGSDTIHTSIAHGIAYDDAVFPTSAQKSRLHGRRWESAPERGINVHRSAPGFRTQRPLRTPRWAEDFNAGHSGEFDHSFRRQTDRRVPSQVDHPVPRRQGLQEEPGARGSCTMIQWLASMRKRQRSRRRRVPQRRLRPTCSRLSSKRCRQMRLMTPRESGMIAFARISWSR